MSGNRPGALPASPPPTTTDSLTEGWGRTLRAIGCARCGAAHVIGGERTLESCAACASGDLADQPVRARPEAPELVVPFSMDAPVLRERLARWCGRCPYPPDELDADRLVQRARRVYLPVWLVDATASATWNVEAGFDYQVASTREQYRNGVWTTHRIEETRIRWEPRAGTLEHRYENHAVPALEDHESIVRRLGEFDTGAPESWNPSLLDDAIVRVPDRAPADAWPNVVTRLAKASTDDVKRACGAQHLRDTHLDANLREPAWTLLLLPIYATSYRNGDGERFPVVIHGQSGRIDGRLHASTRKAWRRSVILAAIAGLVVALGMLFRGVIPAAALAVFGGMLFGIGAFSPIVRAWRFNASHGTGAGVRSSETPVE